MMNWGPGKLVPSPFVASFNNEVGLVVIEIGCVLDALLQTNLCVPCYFYSCDFTHPICKARNVAVWADTFFTNYFFAFLDLLI